VSGSVGAPELLIVLALVVGPLALILAIVVVIDASRRPDAAWEAIGQNRAVWIVVPLVLLLGCGIASLVASIIYLASVRPRLVQATANGRPSP
jgi:hypothetical protein